MLFHGVDPSYFSPSYVHSHGAEDDAEQMIMVGGKDLLNQDFRRSICGLQILSQPERLAFVDDSVTLRTRLIGR